MTLALLTGLFVAAFLLRERMIDAERQRWERERGLLLNRIRPETAQPVDVPDEGAAPQPAAWDDSEAWHDQREAAEIA